VANPKTITKLASKSVVVIGSSPLNRNPRLKPYKPKGLDSSSIVKSYGHYNTAAGAIPYGIVSIFGAANFYFSKGQTWGIMGGRRWEMGCLPHTVMSRLANLPQKIDSKHFLIQ
jgi:hypothetical protein